MGKLHKSLKKLDPLYYADKKSWDQLHPLGTQAETAYDAAEASKKALKEAKDEPVIPMADEDALERERRRRNARRTGGRAATVLSDENRLGG